MILDKKSNENENDSCLKIFLFVKSVFAQASAGFFMG